MPRVRKHSLYKKCRVKTKVAGVMRLWYLNLRSVSIRAIQRGSFHSEWASALSLGWIAFPFPLCCQASSRKSAVAETFWQDYLTCKGFVHWPVILFQTRKKGGFSEKPQQWRNIFVASVEFTLYACAKLKELSSWSEHCQNGLYPFFSQLVSLRGNSAINLSSPVGKGEFGR